MLIPFRVCIVFASKAGRFRGEHRLATLYGRVAPLLAMMKQVNASDGWY